MPRWCWSACVGLSHQGGRSVKSLLCSQYHLVITPRFSQYNYGRRSDMQFCIKWPGMHNDTFSFHEHRIGGAAPMAHVQPLRDPTPAERRFPPQPRGQRHFHAIAFSAQLQIASRRRGRQQSLPDHFGRFLDFLPVMMFFRRPVRHVPPFQGGENILRSLPGAARCALHPRLSYCGLSALRIAGPLSLVLKLSVPRAQ
jgi:hypothetical protein